jgi:dihydroorotate dehydrogenase
MLFISPPFGNYISLPFTTSIAGSFTNEPREGLLLQIIKTLRYSFEMGGWVNKIGLRNKGIDWAIKNVPKNKIISIAIMDKKDIPDILKKLPEDRNIELNVSCPNTEKKMISEGLKYFINPKRKWCIVKISPTTSDDEIDLFYKNGFRQFHCCNTIPVKNGGLSGPKLIPYSIEKISYIVNKYPNTEIIAGGGIQSMKILNMYYKIGANHGSISTLFFHPLRLSKFYIDYIIK